ncbi:MAG: sigma-70 family RNA polymerase sigma factor [Chlamydiae bacterium]|nr:sigma-70 family RNA polymerase sigma factor [Chlamydiota bacterium]MBI3265709.1 sigma-70 family RNA polymerase sigma factor [Chlamydiota bacterium]
MQEFETLIQEHFNPLYHTALRMTRNEADAKDLVQEAILKAFRNYDKFEKGTNFKAWIFKIMTHTYINQYRKKSKEPPLTDFSTVEPIYEEIVKEQPSFSLDQIELLRDQVEDEVSVALDHLPPEYRLVFLLATVEDFSYQEISEVVGCPIGTVMSRLFRARKFLKEELFSYAKERGIVRPQEGKVKP